MAATVVSDSPLKELAHRENDGLEVVLLWHDVTGELTVCVSDERSGAYFELAATPEHALDVFQHPYAHATFRGVPYYDALVPFWVQGTAATRQWWRQREQRVSSTSDTRRLKHSGDMG
jgi:hypothetical protein